MIYQVCIDILLLSLSFYCLSYIGTLIQSNKPINNAHLALKRLIDAKVPFRICSNASKQSHQCVLSDLQSVLNTPIQNDYVFTSISSCKSLVESQSLNPFLILSDSCIKDFKTYSEPYDSVVIGLAPTKLNYDNMNKAFRILLEPNNKLVVTHTSKYFSDKDNQLSLGPGGFSKCLQEVLPHNLEPIICGKPTESFYKLCLSSLKTDNVTENDWSDVAIIGDDAISDLGGGASDLGLKKILVKTGKYRLGDESKVDNLHAVHDSFTDFVDAILQ